MAPPLRHKGEETCSGVVRGEAQVRCEQKRPRVVEPPHLLPGQRPSARTLSRATVIVSTAPVATAPRRPRAPAPAHVTGELVRAKHHGSVSYQLPVQRESGSIPRPIIKAPRS